LLGNFADTYQVVTRLVVNSRTKVLIHASWWRGLFTVWLLYIRSPVELGGGSKEGSWSC